MKKVLLAFIVLIIVAGGLFLTQKYLNGDGGLSFFRKTATVTIGDHSFKTTVAVSQQEREIGLSETKSLSSDRGMIFLFDKPDYYSFWMKNMKFPIDIIYINNDNIVTIFNNVQPPADSLISPAIYTPTEPANKVFEISAGLSEKYKFKKGDKATYENLGN